MKQIFYITLFVISFSVVGISQTITFDKTIWAINPSQVWQADDGGYLLNSGITNIVKTNQYGYIEWQKGYQLSSGSYAISKVIKTLDGGYATVGQKLNGTVPDIWFIKLDQNLDTIWTKVYGAPDKSEVGYDLIQLTDGSYVISSYDNDDFGYYLRKTDTNGNLLWIKNIRHQVTLVQFSYLVNLKDDNFLYGNLFSLMKMNSEADTLWIKTMYPTYYTHQSFFTNDEHILLSTSTNLQKLDLNGNVIWQNSNGNIKAFAQSDDNNYFLLQAVEYQPYLCNILKTDTSGNILSEIQFIDRGKWITNTSDGGFAFCCDFNSRLIKTDSDFNYTAINLKSPGDAGTLNILNTYTINWKSNNVNYVNIEYSTDNQSTWNEIINYFPADTNTFYWTIPQLPDGEIFIRVSDSFNPDIYDRSDPPQSVISYKAYDYIAANEIHMWIGNNGMGSHNPLSDDCGFYWPGGEDATVPAIFADGLVWGGKVNSEIRVNGATYRYGLTPGYILPSGLPSDPLDDKSRMFKLKKDWQYLPPGPERDKYEFDFLNWPVDVGAPWDDNDGDGIYTPGIDEPKIFGDETLFFVANDLDTATSLSSYGSNPIGLEFQVTTFGYNSEFLKDVVFKKYKVINKSNTDITDMYFTYWADDDLGDAGDDYEGFDSTLNLGYCFNGDNDDEGYYGTAPPAVGHMIIQGPIIPSTISDSARYGDGWKIGFRNIGMTATGMILKHNFPEYPTDPNLGDYKGTLEFYNMMQGLNMDGSSIINPITNEPTIWPLSGDPVSGTGWYEGDGWPDGPVPGDRRYHVPTGPFTLASGDTQEVAIAILIKKGTDNINSVAVLKDYAAQIQHWYDNDFVTDVEETNSTIPLEYSLSQNYPNPFNPSTVISYQLPVSGLVSLKVFDILGSEVTTLVNEEKPAGSYQVNFSAIGGASALSSGVYFYRLQAGSFVETKKMLLIK